jgi:hypothetical protein
MTSLGARFVERRVEDGPEMDEPPEENEPKDRGEAKLNYRDQKPALEQLPKTWNEETAKCCDDVAR